MVKKTISFTLIILLLLLIYQFLVTLVKTISPFLVPNSVAFFRPVNFSGPNTLA